MVWDLRGTVKFAITAYTPGAGTHGLGAGCERRGRYGRAPSLGNGTRKSTWGGRKAPSSSGAPVLGPAVSGASAKSRLLSTNRPGRARPPGAGDGSTAGSAACPARGWRAGLRVGSGPRRPRPLAGAARAPRTARTHGRAHCTHTPGARPRRGAGRRAGASVLK